MSLSLGRSGQQHVSRNFRSQWASGKARLFITPHQTVCIDTAFPDSQPRSVSPTSIRSAVSMQAEASGHISPVGWPIFQQFTWSVQTLATTNLWPRPTSSKSAFSAYSSSSIGSNITLQCLHKGTSGSQGRLLRVSTLQWDTPADIAQ